MRRSMFHAALCTLEREEFGRIECAPRRLDSAVITAACEAIPASHPDQYQAARKWLDSLPGDREPGWLTRYALTLPYTDVRA